MTGKLKIVVELVNFLWQGKKWWLLPMVIVLLVIGLLLIVGESSVIAPLVYPLF